MRPFTRRSTSSISESEECSWLEPTTHRRRRTPTIITLERRAPSPAPTQVWYRNRSSLLPAILIVTDNPGATSPTATGNHTMNNDPSLFIVIELTTIRRRHRINGESCGMWFKVQIHPVSDTFHCSIFNHGLKSQSQTMTTTTRWTSGMGTPEPSSNG